MKAGRKTTTPRKTASKKQRSARDALKLRRHPESDELRLLPVAALQMDSLILDEQEDHLVVTIRLPKAVVRDNIHLLMALADRSLGRDSE